MFTQRQSSAKIIKHLMVSLNDVIKKFSQKTLTRILKSSILMGLYKKTQPHQISGHSDLMPNTS